MLDFKCFDLSRQILLESLLLSHLDHSLGKHVCDLALNWISFIIDDHSDVSGFTAVVDEIINLLQKGIRVQFYLEVFALLFFIKLYAWSSSHRFSQFLFISVFGRVVAEAHVESIRHITSNVHIFLILQAQHVIFSTIRSFTIWVLQIFISNNRIFLIILPQVLQRTQNLILLLLVFFGLWHCQPDQELSDARFSMEHKERWLRHVL